VTTCCVLVSFYEQGFVKCPIPTVHPKVPRLVGCALSAARQQWQSHEASVRRSRGCARRRTLVLRRPQSKALLGLGGV